LEVAGGDLTVRRSLCSRLAAIKSSLLGAATMDTRGRKGGIGGDYGRFTMSASGSNSSASRCP
jgi:hypothetical protein